MLSHLPWQNGLMTYGCHSINYDKLHFQKTCYNQSPSLHLSVQIDQMKEVINRYRETHDISILEDFKCQKNDDDWDDNYWNRSELIFELYTSFDQSDKPLIKWLINEELQGIEIELPTETLQICAFMLYKVMDFEDIFDLFNIKYGGGTDLECTTDTELIFGIDKESTKAYLKKNKSEEGDQILSCIEYYESFTSAVYRSRKEYIKFFETIRIDILKSDFKDTKAYLLGGQNTA